MYRFMSKQDLHFCVLHYCYLTTLADNILFVDSLFEVKNYNFAHAKKKKTNCY